jgi:NAD(P)H-hydrate epimerase
MVFYSSISENNQIVHELKKEFRNGIIVPRDSIEDYISEADAVLIGPGMVRTEEKMQPTEDYQLKDLSELQEIEHEGIQTYYLTKYLLYKFPQKKWIIDAGALQMMDPEWLLPLNGNAVLTPHPKELHGFESRINNQELRNKLENKEVAECVQLIAQEYNCTVLIKGEKDIVCSPEQCVAISGGNAGMTKGGTGDVLAGLVAALACKNDLFLAAVSGSYLNKKAGEALFERVGYYFNSSDLADEIPLLMNQLLLQKKFSS